RRSAMVRAVRNPSRKPSVLRFSLANSISLMIRIVQEKIDASSRPIMTIFTTAVASMNMEIGVMSAWLEAAASSPAAAASAAGASATGAASGVAAGADAAAGAGVVVSCARTGELAIRTAAPAMARRMLVFLISSIVRQFLLFGLTHETQEAIA